MKKSLKFICIILLLVIQIILFYYNILGLANYDRGDLLFNSIFLTLYLLSYISIYMLIKDKKNKYLNLYFILSFIFYFCFLSPVMYVINSSDYKDNFYFLTMIILSVVIPSISYVILSYIYKIKNITKNIFFKILYILFLIIFIYLFCFRLTTNMSREIAYYLHKSNIFDNEEVSQQIIEYYNKEYNKHVSYYHNFTNEEKENIKGLYIKFMGNGKINDFKNATITIDQLYAENVIINNVFSVSISYGRVDYLEITNTSLNFNIDDIRDWLTVKKIKVNDYIIDFKNDVTLNKTNLSYDYSMTFDKSIKINEIELSDNLYIEVKDSNNRIKNSDEYLSENDILRIYYLASQGEKDLISGVVKLNN